jgi:transposase-like protein
VSAPTSSISQLQANWFQLHDLDRAQAVAAIRRSGISIRKIARDLKFSPSLLRHLLLALKAPAEDQDLARHGQISTRELVRRAKAASTRRAQRHREVVALERDEAARKETDLICNWLLQTGLHGPSCVMIVDEVRRRLATDEAAGIVPKVSKPLDLPIHEIIRRRRPDDLKDPTMDTISWHAEWLLRWAFCAFPDEQVRWTALDIALERQWER